MRRELEIDAEELLRNGVRALGGKCFKVKFPGTSGAPDRLVLRPGGVKIFVELKRSAGALEHSQENLFPQLERLGSEVRVLYGAVDVELFLKELRDGQES